MFGICMGVVNSANGPSTTATTFGLPMGGNSNAMSFAAESGSCIVTAPVAMQISNFAVNCTAPGAGKSRQFIIRKNATTDGPSVTIANTATFGTDTSTVLSLAAGDTFCIKAIPTGTPAAAAVWWSFNTTTAIPYQVLAGRQIPQTGVAAYSNMFGGTTNSETVEANTQSYIAAAGTLSNLRIHLSTAPGVGKSYTYALMVNGVASALTCAVVDANLDASDTTHSVSVNAGDLVSIRCTPSGTPASSAGNHSIAFSPALAGDHIFGSVIPSGQPAASTTVANYHTPLGTANNSSAFGAGLALHHQPSFLYKNFYAKFNNAPGAGKSYTVRIYDLGTAGDLGVTIADTNTTANSVNQGIRVPGVSAFGMVLTPSGTPTAPTVVNTGWAINIGANGFLSLF